MSAGTRRSPRTKTGLSRSRVLNAALALADQGGVGALSMRKLAERLGVEAMSLYHHFANKDEILDGLVDGVFGEILSPEKAAEWKGAMRDRSHAARAALLRHPWAIRLMESRRNPGLATLKHHEAIIGCLRNGGFSVEMAAHAFSLLDSYVYGFVQQELTLPFRTYEELKEIGEAILKRMPVDEFPHFVELTREHVLRPGYDYADEFDFGLELILDGLERELEKQSSRTLGKT